MGETLNKEINKNYRSYHIPGQANHQSVKKNVIFISRANSIKHELSKCLGSIMIHKFGDVKFNRTILEAIKTIEYEIKQFNMPENPCDFITEACPNDRKDRRIDLVNIHHKDEFEFETDHTIKKEGAITIKI
jgi:hypothetical protein